MSFPLQKTPLKDDKNTLKCSVVLAKRFAEILLFRIFDPTINLHGDVEEEKDIADVMADGQSSSKVRNFYNTMFGTVSEGLKGYAKSIEIFNKSNYVECAWNASFTDNFKIESNLSSDFKSLRQLDDHVFTRSILVLKSASSMAV